MIKNYVKSCIMAGFELYVVATKKLHTDKNGSIPDAVLNDLKAKRIRIVDFIRK